MIAPAVQRARRWAGGLSRRTLLVVAAALVLVAAGLGVGLGLSLSKGPGPPHPHLTATFADPPAGISGRRPPSWHLDRRAGGIAITSPDRTTLVEVAAPAPAPQADAVLQDTVATIGSDYHDVQVLSHPPRRLDRLNAQTVVLAARNNVGANLRVLVATAAGTHTAYLLEVFADDQAPAATVNDAQAIINDLHLSG